MLITFLVRSKQFHECSYHRFYADIKGAFDLAYIIDSNHKTIEFKCLLDETVLDIIPGSSYKPAKLVAKFDYTKEA